jgi:hypothetical protein
MLCWNAQLAKQSSGAFLYKLKNYKIVLRNAELAEQSYGALQNKVINALLKCSAG